MAPASSLNRAYLDYNATAPVRPEAREAALAAMDARSEVARPSAWTDEGLPLASIAARAASRASGRTGAVAL